MPHPVYKSNEIEIVERTHKKPLNFRDYWALFSVKSIRFLFDTMTNYNERKMSEEQWLNRAIFLETIAGVPGMVGAMTRHLKSMRILKKDEGWIHHLLEEAENERIHLFLFLKLKQPGFLFKMFIAAS
jgi:hypothetical protein